MKHNPLIDNPMTITRSRALMYIGYMHIYTAGSGIGKPKIIKPVAKKGMFVTVMSANHLYQYGTSVGPSWNCGS